jgi:nitrite reductase/ring-hydroxylating ferredoxin subunit/plasmid stabilization system protein ParE
MTGRGARRFVEDLLNGRRPRAFPADEATDADIEDLRTAITLRAARPGSGPPREEFVSDLHRRLAAELAGEKSQGGNVRTIGGTRRRFVQGAAIAAAAAAVGVAVDRTLMTGGQDGTRDGQQAAPPAQTLTPSVGDWRTVAASEELPDGAVRAFDLTSLVGFVQRTDGVVQAVSGTCTHQGCRLLLDAASRRLNCPCHRTAFAVDGELLTHELPVAPAPLPHIATREVNGAVQVYAPPPTA